MKYKRVNDETLGWDTITYDTDNLTKTRDRGCGSFSTITEEELTSQEMLGEINLELLSLYKNMDSEIKNIQEKYEEKIRKASECKKALEKRIGRANGIIVL